MASQVPGIRRRSIPAIAVRGSVQRPATARVVVANIAASTAVGGDLAGTVDNAQLVDGVVDNAALADDVKVGSLAGLTTAATAVVPAINAIDVRVAALEIGDAGRSFEPVGAWVPTFPAGAVWSAAGSVQWTQPVGAATPAGLLENEILQWPVVGSPPFREIRPYVAGVYRISAILYGLDGAPAQVWTANTGLQLAVYLNGALFERLGQQFVDITALPGDIWIGGTTLLPISVPQDPTDPGTSGDVIEFRLRASGGAAQTIASAEFSVAIDLVGPPDWTDSSAW